MARVAAGGHLEGFDLGFDFELDERPLRENTQTEG